MLEAKYFRDYKHNYMILQCGQEAAARSYQYKILTSDKIREILKCSVRHINGVTYYYYDISSRTTLQSLYQSTKMSYEQVRDLLWQLHGICDKLAGFFMEESCLVLLPEHIYYDFSAQRYIGLYYPDYRAEEEGAYEPLMTFLLEHIDPGDRRLAEKVYRICEMAGEKHFLLEDALRILEEKEDEVQEATPKSMEPYSVMEDLPPVEPLPAKPRVEEREQVSAVSVRRNPFYPVFAVFSVLGIAIVVVVYCMYDLVQEEELALYGVMAVLGVCFLFSLWGIFRGGAKEKRSGTGAGAMPAADEEQEEFFSEFTGGMRDSEVNGKGRSEWGSDDLPDRSFTSDRNSSPDRNFISGRNPLPDRNFMPEWNSSPDRNFGPGKAGGMDRGFENLSPPEQETDYYGNTIFFDKGKAAENKLYAMDRRNKQHIVLERFPCTVGKMAGCVDHVLADNSVSRIHARFDRQGERVLLTDMNSTNGTYKNGLRMEPQETVEIEPGDEIRFGSLNYCYR